MAWAFAGIYTLFAIWLVHNNVRKRPPVSQCIVIINIFTCVADAVAVAAIVGRVIVSVARSFYAFCIFTASTGAAKQYNFVVSGLLLLCAMMKSDKQEQKNGRMEEEKKMWIDEKTMRKYC